jgi:outer membrane receptor protein involved in Fe transport
VQKKLSAFSALTLLFCTSTPVFASADDFLELSLDELLKIPVNVASRKPMSQKEAPGILTVISGEQIRRSGARDLIDVLRQVPGYDFRLIVSNILGLGVRGHIGSDGRVLVLVDGIEMNEHRFGTAQFGLGFPMESIQRVEIIRGSALALYGGTAEMGVINIITRGADDLSGVEINAAVGMVAGSRVSRKQGGLVFGKKTEAFSLSGSVHQGDSFMSDQVFIGNAGASYNMAEQDRIQPQYVNLGLESGPFKIRYQHDDIAVKSRIANGAIQDNAWSFRQRSDSVLASARFTPRDNLEVNVSVLYQDQSPRETTTSDDVLFSKTTVKRTQGKLGLVWSPSPIWHLAVGAELLNERYVAELRPFPLARTIAFPTLQVNGQYGELMWRGDLLNLTLGTRRDEHEYAGELWSHRLAMTKSWGDWHVKVLASAAHRAPSLEDYSAGRNGLSIRKKEKVRTAEFETGYRINPDTQLTVNVFDITTSDTLILLNNSDVHTRGIEAGLQVRKDWGYADLTLSSYSSAGTDTTILSVIDPATGQIKKPHSLLGFAPWKLAASASIRLNEKMSLTPSVAIFAERWAYDPANSTTNTPRLRVVPRTTLANLALQVDDVGVKGLSLITGLYNLFNARSVYASPFTGSAPPIPEIGREIVLNLRYRF